MKLIEILSYWITYLMSTKVTEAINNGETVEEVDRIVKGEIK